MQAIRHSFRRFFVLAALFMLGLAAGHAADAPPPKLNPTKAM